MKIVSPDDITTLIVNKHHMAIAFCTARAALRHLMSNRVRGIDANGIEYSWDGADPVTHKPSYINWAARNIAITEDQPALRSSAGISGETVEWPIPTIIVCTHYFGFKVDKGEKVNIRRLYKHYKGVCQLCLRHGSISDMTIDHLYPRALGGSNHDFNLILAHRSCNNAKGAQYPYYNAEGKEIKSKPMLRTGVLCPIDPVPEAWKGYMFLE
jgi:hypothetical protein